MATKKDLLEAYLFSRRRLVTALVSGAPGGREVEPPRPGRAIVGGLALAVLLLAGAAVVRAVGPHVDEGRVDGPALVISKEPGRLKSGSSALAVVIRAGLSTRPRGEWRR